MLHRFEVKDESVEKKKKKKEWESSREREFDLWEQAQFLLYGLVKFGKFTACRMFSRRLDDGRALRFRRKNRQQPT